MKNINVFLALLLFPFVLISQIRDNEAIDSLFQEWDKPNSPGCALGIIKQGELVYAKGYGLANLEYEIPNSANSVFRIGSTSKQFTAACIVMLANQGKLNLDDTLNKFFPEFPDYSKKITVKNLLNHTSGIRDYLMISYLKGFSDDTYYQDKDIMSWLINQDELNFSPGEEYLYSNSGYWLLGQIVNKVSGMNMADFARIEIFEPLEMNNTHFHNDHNVIVKNRSSGYMPDGDTGYKISMTTLDMIGDGGIFTTINDIKKWDNAFYESDILKSDFWTAMTEKGILNNGEQIDYASGLGIGEYRGLQTISHGGAFVGFRAELMRFPDQKVSIAIFANRGDANPTSLARKVADIVLTDDFEDEKDAKKTEKTSNSNRHIKLSNKELEAYSGHYWNEKEKYTRKIYLKNDTLRYYRNERSESLLVPVSNNSFKMITNAGNVIVSFEQDEGENEILSFVYNDAEPILSTKYEPKTYSNEELDKFIGQYYSKELEVNYMLKKEKDDLVLYINEDKKSVLKPIMSSIFTNDEYGTFQFNHQTNNEIDGFTLAAGRVKNLKFKKN